MANIEIKPMALSILTKGTSLLEILHFGVGGLACHGTPEIYFYPGDIETSVPACIISNKFETKLH